MLLDSTICLHNLIFIDFVAVSLTFNESSIKLMQTISFFDLLVVIILLKLQRVHSDIVALRLSELFTLTKFF